MPMTDDRTIHDILSAVEHSRIPPLESVKAICTRVLAAEAALAQIRETLAATDIVSLPDDYPTVKMAHDRMERIKELTLQGLAEIGKREAVEARIKVLEDALKAIRSYGDDPYGIARKALEEAPKAPR